MHTDPLTGETWRFDVSADGTITRGRKYRLPEDYSGDNWRNYWDGDWKVAVYADTRTYTAPTDGEDTDRTLNAMQMALEFDQDVHDALARLAPRIAHSWDFPQPWTAQFISVDLDRGTTLYALSWDGDPEGAWRNEIEAVFHGDVWRIETEEWDGEAWQPGDDVYEEWYGEDSAQEGFEREFPLANAPESLHQTGEN